MPSRREPPSLARQGWFRDARLQELLRVLNISGEARVAGGAVRNALMGVPVADVDIATTLSPQQVMAVCASAGFGVHPTGIQHGTVTVTVSKHPFEVTTLRRDVETDGRHAVVQFTKSWEQDARRRDFTINAMYCDAKGKIFDFTEGYEDILARRVRFVGRPSQRIQEDYLRILRFFRFHAFYGRGNPNPEGLRACARYKANLTLLSAERVRQEMLKLLEAPQAIKTLKVMAQSGILKHVLPYTEDWRVLGRLPADGLLRLYALAKAPMDLKDSFRLSNAQFARIASLNAAPDVSPALTKKEQCRMIYVFGPDTWRDAIELSHARSAAPRDDRRWRAMQILATRFRPPSFPLSGRDLMAHGLPAGPEVGRALRTLEDWWLASDFKPGKTELLQHLDLLKG